MLLFWILVGGYGLMWLIFSGLFINRVGYPVDEEDVGLAFACGSIWPIILFLLSFIGVAKAINYFKGYK